MSSATTEPTAMTERTDVRPARWPWILVAAFFLIVAGTCVLVRLNGESLVQQIPLIVAFGMFAVVGALIVSRDRGNVIGLMLLVSALIIATLSALFGEAFTWLVLRGYGGAGVALLGFANNLGWLLSILPVVLFLPLLFPDGHLPSPRWKVLVWAIFALLVMLFVSLLFGQARFTGSVEAVSIANPFYVEAIGRLPKLDPLVGVLFPLFCLFSIISLIQRFRRSTGVVRQQIKWAVFGFLFAVVGVSIGGWFPEGVLNSFVLGIAFLAFPLSVGIAVLRFHLYDLDVVVKKTVVYAALAVFATIVYLALVVGLGATFGTGELVPHDGGRGDRRGDVPTGASVVDPVRQPDRVRETCHAVRGADRVLRAGRRRVRRRGRAAADGACARRGDRGRARRCLARGGSGAPRCGGVAIGGGERGVDPPPERHRAGDRGRRPCVSGAARRRVARRARDPQAAERSGHAVGREADRRPRRPGGARAPQRAAHRGAQAPAARPEGRAEAAGLGAGRGAAQARAEHPRRRAAAAGRAAGPPAPRRAADRAGAGESEGDGGAAPGRHRGRPAGPAGSGARDLPAAAGRRRARGRAHRAGAQGVAAGGGRGRGHRPVQPERRGRRLLLGPRGAAERGEVRGRVRGAGAGDERRRRAPVRGL